MMRAHSSSHRGTLGALKVGLSSQPCSPSMIDALFGTRASTTAAPPFTMLIVLLKASREKVFTDLRRRRQGGQNKRTITF